MQIEAATLFMDAIRWLAAGAVALLAWLIRGLLIRVNKLEDRVVSREELQYMHSKLHDKIQNKVDKEYLHEYMQRAEVLRTETRQMITSLYEKIDAIKDMVIHLSQQMDSASKNKP